MKHSAIALAAMALTGCAFTEPQATIDPVKLQRPADHLMIPVKALPPTPPCFAENPKNSQDAHRIKQCKAAHLTDLRLRFGDEAVKVSGLQEYVEAVTR